MKIKKYFSVILLSTSLVACGSTGPVDNGPTYETNYFTPTVDTKFDNVTKEFFITKLQENINNGVQYSYVGFDISFSKPYTINNTSLSNLYYVGNINHDFFSNDQYQGASTWIDQNKIYSEGLGINEFSTVSAVPALTNCYKQFSENGNFTSSPYSCEYATNERTYKYVFSDSFLLESISYSLGDIDVTLKAKYFNETDLPDEKGKITRDTYINFAYISYYKDTNIQRIETTLKGKNVVVDTKTEYDPKYDVDVMVDTRGSVTIDSNINLEKYSQNGSGKSNYLWKLKDYQVTSGKITDNHAKALLAEYITGTKAYQYPLELTGSLFDENNESYTYRSQPLSVSIISANKTDYIEFSNEGLITKRTFNDKKTKEIVQITYKYF